MEGTACGVLPLCIKRTRALSYCARHQWVWLGCIHTQTHVDWLIHLSYFLVSLQSHFFLCSEQDVIFCLSICLPALTDLSVFHYNFTSNLLLQPHMIIFLLASLAHVSKSLLFQCIQMKSCWVSVFWSGRSLVWDCLKYPCQTSPRAHFHPHWRILWSMTAPPSDKL